ncbi:hypothetical protein CC2G_002947 [Coprinopsis cinerea AmutBmut pab1-1]|nr:hypothetical protein CC2G_002947 [Coprinopsis cinerea AmutBmut pab1-1]
MGDPNGADERAEDGGGGKPINVLGQSEDVLYTVNMKYRGALCWSGLPSHLSRKVSRKDPPRTVWKAKLKGSLVSNKMLPPVCLMRTQKIFEQGLGAQFSHECKVAVILPLPGLPSTNFADSVLFSYDTP